MEKPLGTYNTQLRVNNFWFTVSIEFLVNYKDTASRFIRISAEIINSWTRLDFKLC